MARPVLRTTARGKQGPPGPQGERGPQGAQGPQGERGLPGVNAVPAADLLAGDIEADAQRVLAGAVPPVQVLKVPHHGSRSQDRRFLAAARASVALISVGRGNDYGHPSPATLALLRDLRVRVHRTDREGDIAVVEIAAGVATVSRK